MLCWWAALTRCKACTQFTWSSSAKEVNGFNALLRKDCHHQVASGLINDHLIHKGVLRVDGNRYKPGQ